MVNTRTEMSDPYAVGRHRVRAFGLRVEFTGAGRSGTE